jgi:hypothetical protein
MAAELVSVNPVSSRRDLRAFIDVPFRIMAHDEVWSPPLRVEVRRRLDARRNPFHEHAEVAYLIARRSGRAVGRVAAFVDRNYDEHYGNDTLLFGWFDCEDSEQTFSALTAALEAEAKRRNRSHLLGPLTFSMHEEAGLLVEGFDTPHRLMTPHNPAWYGPLFERNSWRKAEDLLAYRWISEQGIPPKLSRVTRRVLADPAVELACIRMDHFDEDIEAIYSVLNDSFRTTWGHIDLTRKEFQATAADLRKIADPRLVYLVRVDGVPAAFGVTVPDWNQAIRKARGRLLPLGLIRIMRARKKIDGARFLLLGVRQDQRARGLAAVIIQRTMEDFTRLGYREGELSMVLESNEPMRRIIEGLVGSKAFRRYRIYEKDLTPSGRQHPKQVEGGNP